ncbi:hypothetical protein K488DRAFT_81413 [Vararia minispora EC-137]|uniref:Uncharacterized protein n=1 Tax=Vararia minispora EC-137 TaxID=1314806 RepID=A0ACB8R0N4_9AGAM|nr:hypothetical protein K488DRAFT_81413 [Vararia minispora EC-137]
MPVQNSKLLLDADLDDSTKDRLRRGVREVFKGQIDAARRALDSQLEVTTTDVDEEMARKMYESTLERLSRAMTELYGEHIREYRQSIDVDLTFIAGFPSPQVPPRAALVANTAGCKSGSSSWLSESVAWANAAPTLEEYMRKERTAWSAYTPVYMDSGGCGHSTPTIVAHEPTAPGGGVPGLFSPLRLQGPSTEHLHYLNRLDALLSGGALLRLSQCQLDQTSQTTGMKRAFATDVPRAEIGLSQLDRNQGCIVDDISVVEVELSTKRKASEDKVRDVAYRLRATRLQKNIEDIARAPLRPGRENAQPVNERGMETSHGQVWNLNSCGNGYLARPQGPGDARRQEAIERSEAERTEQVKRMRSQNEADKSRSR